MWKSSFTKLIAIYTKVVHIADQEKLVHVGFFAFFFFFFNFRKVFNTYSSLQGKMASIQLEKFTVWQVNNWFTGQAQMAIVNGVTPGWQLLLGLHMAQF